MPPLMRMPAGLLAALWLLCSISLSTNPVLAAGEPVALVETVSGRAAGSIQPMDSVFEGQVIELGNSGQLTIAYLYTCRVEKISGGRVTIGSGESQVEGGQVEALAAPCEASRFDVSQGRQEAAGAVYRVTAFEGQDWGERTISSDRPVFRWNATGAGALTSVAVIDMDRKPPAVVWNGVTDKSVLPYPGDGPALEIGVPYQVQVTTPDGALLGANFSIDLGLEGADTILGRLVPVTQTIPGK